MTWISKEFLKPNVVPIHYPKGSHLNVILVQNEFDTSFPASNSALLFAMKALLDPSGVE